MKIPKLQHLETTSKKAKQWVLSLLGKYTDATAEALEEIAGAIPAKPEDSGALGKDEIWEYLNDIVFNSPFVVKNGGGTGESALILDRSSRANWKITNDGGNLRFLCDWTDQKNNEYYEVMKLSFNSKVLTAAGEVRAPSFVGNLTGTATEATEATKSQYIKESELTNPSALTKYTIPFHTPTNSHWIPRYNDGLAYQTQEGTASNTAGYAGLVLGNNQASNTVGKKRGRVSIYSTSSNYVSLYAEEGSSSVGVYLPAKAGTLALKTDPTQAVVSGAITAGSPVTIPVKSEYNTMLVELGNSTGGYTSFIPATTTTSGSIGITDFGSYIVTANTSIRITATKSCRYTVTYFNS